MTNLYIKTAERIADIIRYHLIMVSDKYEKWYSEYLASRDVIKENLTSVSSKEAFEELSEKMDEKLRHELLRTILVLIDPKQEAPLFTFNTSYIMRNGDILDLRRSVQVDLYTKNELLERYENAHKKLTAFHLGLSEEYISEFFKSAYDYYC